MHARGEIEFRIDGSQDPRRLTQITAILKELDPDASVRRDPATGIVHALTKSDTLDVLAALGEAGFEPSAASG